MARLEWEHFEDPSGTHRCVNRWNELDPNEQAEVPPATRALFEGWSKLMDSAPPELAWFAQATRRRPWLERCAFDPGGVYHAVRLPLRSDPALLRQACFGVTGADPDPSLPEPLAFLSQLGRATLVAGQSGTFGVVRRPDGRVSVYEADGDEILVDLATGEVTWEGPEWGGPLRIAAPWPLVVRFALWRVLDLGWVRPLDLQMLAP